MIGMVVLSGFAVLTVNAVTWRGVDATPRSCSVGDTITITVTGGVDVNEYRYGYRIDNTGDYVIFQEWTSSPTSIFIPSASGSYSFIVYCRDGNSSSNARTSPVVVSGSESSEPESSEPESSEPESSEPESSFDPMGWMPSNWQGDGYIQPSAESTPELSYNLPSDVELSVPEGMTGIISKAFQALPSPILVLLIPTVIALFVGWWLHK